jgi:hypothetical protein
MPDHEDKLPPETQSDDEEAFRALERKNREEWTRQREEVRTALSDQRSETDK